jgi:zinc transport system permease protein
MVIFVAPVIPMTSSTMIHILTFLAPTRITTIMSIMFDPFFLKILGVATFLGILAGPFGVVVVWQRMALMGDMLSHCAILALVLSHFLSLPLLVIYLIFSSVLSMVFHQLRLKKYQPEQLMMVLSYASLSIGVICLSQMSIQPIKFQQILFGDLLSISNEDIFWMIGGGIFLLAHFIAIWKPLLMMTFHEELAQIEGVPVNFLKSILTILLGGIIALSIKIAGALLIVGLLLVPSLTAVQLSKTPEGMVIRASIVGAISAAGGCICSFHFDWPIGPAIITVSFGIFCLSLLKKGRG